MRSTIFNRAALIAAALTAAFLAASEPLVPHRIKDMLLVGKEGTAGSTVARNVFYREGYLYVAGEPGLQTVDARDPAHLVLSAEWPHSSAKMNGLAAMDNVLFAANWSPGEGLVYFGVSDPANPVRIGTLATSAHTWELTIHGDVLHVGIDDGITTGIARPSCSDSSRWVIASSETRRGTAITSTSRTRTGCACTTLTIPLLRASCASCSRAACAARRRCAATSSSS